MTDSIITYAWNYPLPYITISYSTGQWFVTAIWEKYHQLRQGAAQPLTRIMMDGREGAAPWVFFNHTRGGTWDNWDNKMFKWIGDHLFIFVLTVGALIISALAVTIAAAKGIKKYYSQSTSKDRGKYSLLWSSSNAA